MAYGGSSGVGVGAGVGVGVGSGVGVGVGVGAGRIPWSYYATPLELGFKPWALDFSPNNPGEDSFPKALPQDFVNLRWQNSDWDPALRFWNLPFDPTLAEWLKDQDAASSAILAAREFAGQYQKWAIFDELTLGHMGWLDTSHLGWKNGLGATSAREIVEQEISQLFRAMEDDRDRWLAEINYQADGLAGYFIHFLGIDSERKPWTIELIRSGLAIGNLVYMYYKAMFRRVRPSRICPGLVPPFGPPRHPSFPSGHSFLGHFIALLLLEIEEIDSAFGEDSAPVAAILPAGVRTRVFAAPKKSAGVSLSDVMSTSVIFGGPLLWFADRLAKNRERLGVHYPSDSKASRWLAGAIWKLLVTDAGNENSATPPKRTSSLGPLLSSDLIACPSLRHVMYMAKAEWKAF